MPLESERKTKIELSYNIILIKNMVAADMKLHLKLNFLVKFFNVIHNNSFTKSIYFKLFTDPMFQEEHDG